MTTKLPSSLYNTYRRYKQDEQQLTHWVWQSAKQCGHVFLSSITRSDELSVLQILPPLKSIAASSKIVSVPDQIARCLQKIILQRTKCVAWFEKNTKHDDLETQHSNESHLYPLSILRDATSLLQHKLPANIYRTKKKSDEENAASQDPLLDFVNRFNGLTVEEADVLEKLQSTVADKDVLHEATNTSTRDKPKEKPVRDSTFNMTEDEMKMLQYCIMEDMQVYEAVVVREWISYLVGAQTITGATLVSEHAIDMLRQQEQDQFMRNVDLSTGLRSNVMIFMRPTGVSSTLERTEAGNIISPIYRMQEIVSDYLSGKFQQWDLKPKPGRPRTSHYFDSTIDEQADWERETLLILIYTVQDAFFSASKGEGRCNMFTRLMACALVNAASMTSSDSFPFVIAFAARMQVLIYHICDRSEEKVRCDFNQLTERIEKRLLDVERCLTIKLPVFDNVDASVKQNWLKWINGWKQVLPTWKMQRDRGVFGIHNTFYFLLVYTIESSLNIPLIELVFHTQTFVAIAILFDICSQEGMVSVEWPDLSFLSSHVTEELIYNGMKSSKADRRNLLKYLQGKLGYKIQSGEDLPEDFQVGLCMDHDCEPFFSRRRTNAATHCLLLPASSICITRVYNKDLFYDTTSESVRLAVRGITLPRLLGQTPKYANLVEREKRYSLENHHDLASLAAAGPMLSIEDHFALLRDQLRHEQELASFDFSNFYKGCVHFGLLLGQCDGSEGPDADKGFFDISQPDIVSAKFKLQLYTTMLATVISGENESPTGGRPRRLKEFAGLSKNLANWIAKKGDVGMKSVQAIEPERKHLSTLDPALQTKLKDLVMKHGIPDDAFSPQQTAGIDWFEQNTYSLEEAIRGKCSTKAKDKDR